jgi:16S rRNA (guanine527-N7)-methyltransferase
MNRSEFERELRRALEKHNCSLRATDTRRLFAYYKELFSWNEKMNLISRGEVLHFIERHITDSLCALQLGIKKGSHLLDIGSGNGLPGIPLAIALPAVHIDLLESRENKCIFLRHLIAMLRLANTAVLCGRLEELHGKPGSYDYVLVRGVRISHEMNEKIAILLKDRGALVLYLKKGQHPGVLRQGSIEWLKGVQGRRLGVIRYTVDHEALR